MTSPSNSLAATLAYVADQAITVSLDLRDELPHLTGQPHPCLSDLRTRFAHLTHLTQLNNP